MLPCWHYRSTSGPESLKGGSSWEVLSHGQQTQNSEDSPSPCSDPADPSQPAAQHSSRSSSPSPKWAPSAGALTLAASTLLHSPFKINHLVPGKCF